MKELFSLFVLVCAIFATAIAVGLLVDLVVFGYEIGSGLI